MSRRWKSSRPGGLLRELIRKSVADRVNGLAAESAYFGVLSLFPGVMVLAAALGWLDHLAGSAVAQRAEAVVLDTLRLVLTDQAAGVIQSVRDLFERGRRGLLTGAALFAVWALSRGFATIIGALDQAYGLREGRSWLNRHITALLLSVGSAVVAALILAATVAGPFLGHGVTLATRLGYGNASVTVRDWVRLPIAVVLVVLWTTTLYHLAPNRRAPWRRDLPGALLAALLWLLVSFGFSLYLHAAAGMNRVFGVLGGGLILMMWVYLLCLSLIAGGELNAILLSRAGIARRGGRFSSGLPDA